MTDDFESLQAVPAFCAPKQADAAKEFLKKLSNIKRFWRLREPEEAGAPRQNAYCILPEMIL